MTNVFPCLTVSNVADSGFADSECLADLFERHCSMALAKLKDFSHSILRELGVPMLTTACHALRVFCRPLSCAALTGTILQVFFLSAKEQMVWSNTGRVIASVTDIHTRRNFAIGQRPRNPMGSLRGSTATTHTHEPVAALVAAAGPIPAGGCEINLTPEASLKRAVLFAGHDNSNYNTDFVFDQSLR